MALYLGEYGKVICVLDLGGLIVGRAYQNLQRENK